MNIAHKSDNPLVSEQGHDAKNWTAGPVLSSHKRKGFDHTGMEIRVIDMELYVLEVFPPRQVARHMGQPAPDISQHLENEGLDSHKLNKRLVSFIAHVSLPLNVKDSGVEITLKSEQRQNGGVYEQETSVPLNMICVSESPVATVLDSLNKALHEYNWYPPY